MRHEVKYGESPSLIAHAYGVPFEALINANPHKPLKVVNGRTTWDSILPRETVIVPTGGMVGDAVSDALNALVSAGGPCLQANVRLVCAAQSALGFVPGAGVDGKWGTNASTEAKKHGFNVPGCTPRPSWWTPAGQSNCPAGLAAPKASAPAASVPSASKVALTAAAALAALRADAGYCASVKRSGTAVNTAVHNFKDAWNSANPGNRVPINTGNYEPSVAMALSSALGGAAVPPGCGAAATSAPTPAPVQQPAPVPTPAPVMAPAPSLTPAPTPAPASSPTIPSAVLGLLSFNPCEQVNVELTRQAQRALGLLDDGKYGTTSQNAARRLVPNAPAACSPAPLWWGTKATRPGPTPTTPPSPPSSVPVSTPTPAPAPVPVVAPAPTPTPSSGATPTPAPGPMPGPEQPIVVAPEAKKGLSTGTIVVGALGAAALLGLVAVAATGKPGKRGARGARGPRPRKSGHRKPVHHKKPAHHKRKATKKKR